jgi:MSHA biogenesis protein MshK
MSRLVLALAAVLAAGTAQAAPFADPTQPPARGAGEAGALSGPRVESILIAPDRRLAVVNGQQVTVGSRFGAGTVVRITETEVVVRGSEGEQKLRLYPELAAKKGRSK